MNRKLQYKYISFILYMTMDISGNLNLAALCEQNNVSKTNTLRAISLFFNPEAYVPELICLK